MSEFCLDCVNKIFNSNFKWYHVRFFSGKDICEECGKEKKLVARFSILGDIKDTRDMYKELKKP
jgi:hypothetical protein